MSSEKDRKVSWKMLKKKRIKMNILIHRKMKILLIAGKRKCVKNKILVIFSQIKSRSSLQTCN